MKRAAVIDMLADRDRSAADTLAALQRLDDTTTGGITVRRLLDGLAAAHVPASEPATPLVWRKGEAVPEWLVEGARVRVIECIGQGGHPVSVGTFMRPDGAGYGWVQLGHERCTLATALELVAPVLAAADPDVDATDWKRRAFSAEERIDRAMVAHNYIGDPVDALTAMVSALRGES